MVQVLSCGKVLPNAPPSVRGRRESHRWMRGQRWPMPNCVCPTETTGAIGKLEGPNGVLKGSGRSAGDCLPKEEIGERERE